MTRHPCGCLVAAHDYVEVLAGRRRVAWVYDRRIGWHDPNRRRIHEYTAPTLQRAAAA
jgi:hypothetical protein